MATGCNMPKKSIRLRLPKDQANFLKKHATKSLSKFLNKILSDKDFAKKLKPKDLEFEFVGVAIEEEILEKIKKLAEKNGTSVTHIIQEIIQIAMESDGDSAP